jgi:SAM-dependent methyltransferase
MSVPQPQSPPPEARFFEMFLAPLLTQALHAAAALGIADLLADGPRDCDDLAAACDAHAASLYRILRALAASGIFTEVSPGRFGLNPVAELLRSDVPGSMRGMAMWSGTRAHWNPLSDILHSARTGKPAFDHVFGKGPFAYFEEDKKTAAIFNHAMSGFSASVVPAAVEAYDFSQFGCIADIAGGHGVALAKVLSAHPATCGILFDLPHVVAGAPAVLESNGVAERCQVVHGDFFNSVPEGADAYMMKHIVHDWDDERALAILSNCRRASKAGGKLLLIEMVVPEGIGGAAPKLLDLEMMLLPGGLERTEVQYARLFEGSGFRLTRVFPTRSPVSVIEGEAV